MTVNLVEILSKQLPELVNAATAEFKANADKDPELAQRYADLEALPGAFRVVLEGKGGADLYLVSEQAQFRADKSAPSGVPVWLAVGVNAEEANVGLEELEDELQKGLAFLRKRLTRQNPKRLRGVLEKLAKEQLKYHLVIKETPDFDEVRIKIALGGNEPPEKPNFTVSIDYDTLAQVRDRKLKPQALLGKLQLSGDSSRFMALLMELAQRR
ncbi:MAG TPA: SCP2 sterol-binding domain-containing protein [Polyangiales bacterium]|nr:SCP2 sterol-binding domain-containing protein [Polyangiales bacterium]